MMIESFTGAKPCATRSYAASRTSQPAAPRVGDEGHVLRDDAARLLERRAAPVIVELTLLDRRRDDGHLRRLLAPDEERAPHVIRRAHEQDARRVTIAQQVVDERHVLVRVRRALFE